MKTSRKVHSRRRGVVAVQTAIALPMLIAFAALTVDLGRLFMAKNQLQVAADSAALAGVSGYLTDPSLASALSDLDRRNNPDVLALVRDRARRFSYENATFGRGTQLETADIVLGTYDSASPNAPLDTSGAQPFNAVQVTVRRAAGGSNGPVDFMFAGIFGLRSGGVAATATAVMDDRFKSFDPNQGSGAAPLIPVGIHKDVYEYLSVHGPDVYSYDETGRSIETSGDGIGEVVLFPWKWFGNGDAQGMLDMGIVPPDVSGEGAGNYGFLDFGADPSSANELSAQIVDGISHDDLEATIGTEKLDFVDEAGNPLSYPVSGAPGMKVNTASAFEERLGDIVGFFIYDQLRYNGTNCEYRITGVRFARMMHVQLHGSPKSKAVIVQPAAYSGAGIWIDEAAPPTGGQVGKLALVK